MRWLRGAVVIAALLALAGLAGIWLLRALFGTTDREVARAEVQTLYVAAGHRDVRVTGCRTATERDMDSPSKDAFVCTVRTPSCTRNSIFFVRRAVEPGWIDAEPSPRRELPRGLGTTPTCVDRALGRDTTGVSNPLRPLRADDCADA